MMSFRKRAASLLAGTFVAYALLVATHAGEFWPFSIYPMFSQAGHPWSRVVVRSVAAGDAPPWQAVAEADALPGRPLALAPLGVNPNDLAEYLAKREDPAANRWGVVRRMLRAPLAGPGASPEGPARSLLLVRVDGRLVGRDSVAVQFVPAVLLRPDTTLLPPPGAQP